jgi:hypothetical protein
MPRGTITPVSARQNAQQGKALIKEAILELLESERGKWLLRSVIEDALGIGSEYKGSGEAKSYKGGLAAMLLSELVEERKIKRSKTGIGWLYSVSK